MADLDRDLYDVLGVVPSASAAEVTSAYRRRVRDLHPDSRQEGRPDVDPTDLSEVLAAFHVLRNPEKRAAYDAHRRRRRHGPSAGGVPIAVRRIGVEERSPTNAWLRAGPARLDRTSPDSRHGPSPAARPVSSWHLFCLIDDLFRRPW